jgi:hypothetical protein
MTTIYLDHSKNLPPLECKLYDWQKAYYGHDWFELQDLFKRQKLEADWAEGQELHDELKFHGSIAEIVAEGKAQKAAAWAGQGPHCWYEALPEIGSSRVVLGRARQQPRTLCLSGMRRYNSSSHQSRSASTLFLVPRKNSARRPVRDILLGAICH